MNIRTVLANNKCKLVFVISLMVGYNLIPPLVVIYSPFIAWPFLIVFATTSACTIKAMVESSRANKGHGVVSIFSSFFGLAALSACSTSFVCGAAGIGILSMFVQGLALADFMHEYGVYVVFISMLIQIYSLYKMKCFYNCTLFSFLQKTGQG